MKNWIQISLLVLILSSCRQKQNENKETPTRTRVESSNSTVSDYSEEFQNHFTNSSLTLKNDSIIFPIESGIEDIVIIPSYIPRKKSISFKSETKDYITITQINYTDIEFVINYLGEETRGKASLSPHFFLGFETVGFSDGEYIITHYYVTETDNPCIDFIGLGNQNITEENSENVYALVSVSGDTCKDELKELTNKKLKTVANKTYKQ